MRRRVNEVSDRVLDVAAAAYDLEAETSNPAPDGIMRARARQRLATAVAALTYEERVMLARRAGR